MGPEAGPTRRAVVSYEVDAPARIKRQALREGLVECAAGLLELGMSVREVVEELEQVANDAEQGELL
jgi:hypothetical protein